MSTNKKIVLMNAEFKFNDINYIITKKKKKKRGTVPTLTFWFQPRPVFRAQYGAEKRAGSFYTSMGGAILRLFEDFNIQLPFLK